MNFESYIKRNVQTVEYNVWLTGKASASGETPLFVLDENNYPIGTLNIFGGIDPIGKTTLLSLRSISVDLSSYEIWAVFSDTGNLIGWFKKSELYEEYYSAAFEKLDLLRRMFKSLPCKLVAVDEAGVVQYANDDFMEDYDFSASAALGRPLCDIAPEHPLLYIVKNARTAQLIYSENGFLHIQCSLEKNGEFIGAMQISFLCDSVMQPAVFESASSDGFITDIRAYYDSNWDVVYASDKNGITLDVSSACEELWGLKAEELIGTSVYELEERGVYQPSITKMVLETGERVQAFQTTQTGRNLIVVGTPIKNSKGEITRVVNVSRDVTDENRLQQELHNTKMLLEGYLHELEQLRSKDNHDNQFVYNSPIMQNVSDLALKVSNVDTTIMITGESGVGKEVLANFIHSHSHRKDKPFVKINCSAIPPQLLESELFGYEKGAFTGAGKSGKPGIFELANTGTLFLDEIGEIPLDIQVKLLRVMQENEFMRVGGTKTIKVDIRVIAATNRDLAQEVQNGTFRKDLFYRLNVVPLNIPPLRSRPDDILPLTMHFLDQFNKKHQKCKTICAEVLEVFQNHPWEGNIRELQNMVERLVILSDQDTIGLQDLPPVFTPSIGMPHITISSIMPLKDAVALVENQLIEMARKQYKTTKGIAQALGVDQSTISRKMNR